MHEVAHDYMRTSGSQPSSIAKSSAGVGQKPSWFNNAGHTGTFAIKGGSQPTVMKKIAHTKQRYTILTSLLYGSSRRSAQSSDVVQRIAWQGNP